MSSAKWIVDPERRITHPSLPSMAAAPPGMIFVMKIPGSSGICGLSTPPAMLNPRPELPYRWHTWEEYWRNADVSQRFAENVCICFSKDTWLSILCKHQQCMDSFMKCLVCFSRIQKYYQFLPISSIHTSSPLTLLFSFQCQKAETGWSVWQSHLKRQALKQTAEKRLHFIIFYN